MTHGEQCKVDLPKSARARLTRRGGENQAGKRKRDLEVNVKRSLTKRKGEKINKRKGEDHVRY